MSDPVQVPQGYEGAADLLAGHTILVTGASGAIGSASARRAAAHGATVILLGKTVRRLEAVYDAIVEAGGPQPAIYPMNLEGAGPTDYDDLAARIGEGFGRLDALVLCSGVPGTPSPLEHQDVAEWLRVTHVNLHAPFLLARVLLPLLRAAPHPSVVALLSSLALAGRAYRGAYAVSQAALRALVEIMADELEGAVRVNALDPGPTRSALRAASHPAEDRSQLAAPETAATGVTWLLGADSAGLTGAYVRM